MPNNYLHKLIDEIVILETVINRRYENQRNHFHDLKIFEIMAEFRRSRLAKWTNANDAESLIVGLNPTLANFSRPPSLISLISLISATLPSIRFKNIQFINSPTH